MEKKEGKKKEDGRGYVRRMKELMSQGKKK